MWRASTSALPSSAPAMADAATTADRTVAVYCGPGSSVDVPYRQGALMKALYASAVDKLRSEGHSVYASRMVLWCVSREDARTLRRKGDLGDAASKVELDPEDVIADDTFTADHRIWVQLLGGGAGAPAIVLVATTAAGGGAASTTGVSVSGDRLDMSLSDLEQIFARQSMAAVKEAVRIFDHKSVQMSKVSQTLMGKVNSKNSIVLGLRPLPADLPPLSSPCAPFSWAGHSDERAASPDLQAHFWAQLTEALPDGVGPLLPGGLSAHCKILDARNAPLSLQVTYQKNVRKRESVYINGFPDAVVALLCASDDAAAAFGYACAVIDWKTPDKMLTPDVEPQLVMEAVASYKLIRRPVPVVATDGATAMRVWMLSGRALDEYVPAARLAPSAPPRGARQQGTLSSAPGAAATPRCLSMEQGYSLLAQLLPAAVKAAGDARDAFTRNPPAIDDSDDDSDDGSEGEGLDFFPGSSGTSGGGVHAAGSSAAAGTDTAGGGGGSFGGGGNVRGHAGSGAGGTDGGVAGGACSAAAAGGGTQPTVVTGSSVGTAAPKRAVLLPLSDGDVGNARARNLLGPRAQRQVLALFASTGLSIKELVAAQATEL